MGSTIDPFPVTTFASIADLGLELHVYCPRCFALRRVDPLGERIRDRQFARARFICHRCGARGMAQLEPPDRLPAGGPVTLAFLWCDYCLWEAKGLPIDIEPWSAIVIDGFFCRGCRKPVRAHVHEPKGPGGLPPTEPPQANPTNTQEN